MAINPPDPTARPPRRGSIPCARWVALLAVLVLAWVGASPAKASSGARVVVGSRTLTISGGQISQQGDGGTYTVEGFPPLTLHGMSIATLLGFAGTDPSTVTSVIVGGITLLPADITSPDPAGPPLITVRPDGSTRFVRNAGAGGPGVYISTPAGAPIDVAIQGTPQSAATPAELQVTVSAAPSEVSPGQSVSFVAEVANAPAAPLHYSWSFGDGATASGPAPNHAFQTDGDYPTAVTVSAGEGTSAIGHLVVHVGHPHRRASGTGLGNSSATGSGAGGTGSGKGGTGGGTGTGGQGATQPRPQPKPATKQPAQPTRPVGSAPQAATPAPSGAAPEPVRGVLLADAGSPLDLRPSPPPPSGSSGAAHKSRGGSSGWATVAAGIALALVVVTLGGLAERRRLILRPA
ncbi:MAG: PKD domain-containing protein [Actinobacteria bacterium]|nr:PKD domain-containing protein [Actinomycetota bacterium]